MRARRLARLRLAWVVRVGVVVCAIVNVSRGADIVTATSTAVLVVLVWGSSYWMERRIRQGAP